jgi:hypothetical protein
VGAVALVARLVPNFVLDVGAAYDIESYGIVGDLLLRGEEVYAATAGANRHPYLPCQVYWIGFARWAAPALHLPFVQIVRLAPILADVGIALLLYLKHRSNGMQAASHCGLSYALNPVSVLVSAYHGQFDAIPALLLLLAMIWHARSAAISGGWLGLAILNKSWPVLALPSLAWVKRGWRGKLVLVGAVLLVPLIGLGLYIGVLGGDPFAILRRAMGYNWGVGIWGYSYFSRLLSFLRPDLAGPFVWLQRNGRYLTVTALGLVWLVRARKENVGAGVLTILVSFFAVTHAFSIQYLVWLVPFATLEQDDRWLVRFSLAAFAYMLLVYTTLILQNLITRLLPWPQADLFIIMPAALPAWLVTVGWMYSRLRKQAS